MDILQKFSLKSVFFTKRYKQRVREKGEVTNNRYKDIADARKILHYVSAPALSAKKIETLPFEAGASQYTVSAIGFLYLIVVTPYSLISLIS